MVSRRVSSSGRVVPPLPPPAPWLPAGGVSHCWWSSPAAAPVPAWRCGWPAPKHVQQTWAGVTGERGLELPGSGQCTSGQSCQQAHCKHSQHPPPPHAHATCPLHCLPVGVVMTLTCLSCTTGPSPCIWLHRVSQVSSAVTPHSRPHSLHAPAGGRGKASSEAADFTRWPETTKSQYKHHKRQAHVLQKAVSYSPT